MLTSSKEPDVFRTETSCRREASTEGEAKTRFPEQKVGKRLQVVGVPCSKGSPSRGGCGANPKKSKKQLGGKRGGVQASPLCSGGKKGKKLGKGSGDDGGMRRLGMWGGGSVWGVETNGGGKKNVF